MQETALIVSEGITIGGKSMVEHLEAINHTQAVEFIKEIACNDIDIPLIRVAREGAEEQGCITFSDADDLLEWLRKEPGNIFVTTGSSHADLFAKLPDYKDRVWMRILPSIDSLRVCLDSGYLPQQLICMQGPFSEEINRAMFGWANARILVTKNSGTAGGFTEKVRAAESLGMIVAVIKRPEESRGVTFEEAAERIMELRA